MLTMIICGTLKPPTRDTASRVEAVGKQNDTDLIFTVP